MNTKQTLQLFPSQRIMSVCLRVALACMLILTASCSTPPVSQATTPLVSTVQAEFSPTPSPFTATDTPPKATPFAYECTEAADKGAEKRVLFIGNSLTYYEQIIYTHDLPGAFTALTCSGGQSVTVGKSSELGWTLSQLAKYESTFNMLEQKWDIVVLQEYEQLTRDAELSEQMMYPAIRILASKIVANGAQPMLFLNWATRDGGAGVEKLSYDQRQDLINASFSEIATELNIPIAPVGKAFQLAITQPEPIDPWSVDGLHANEAGTYLTACVFYGMIFNQSPVGLPYHGNLSEDTAQALQEIAIQAIEEQ